MNIAEEIKNVFETLELDEGGFIEWEALSNFRKELKERSLMIYETHPESSDSTRIYTFEDGSGIVLDNPIQDCFAASCSIASANDVELAVENGCPAWRW